MSTKPRKKLTLKQKKAPTPYAPPSNPGGGSNKKKDLATRVGPIGVPGNETDKQKGNA